MKKKMRRIQLHRETLRQLDQPPLGGVDAAGTAIGGACSGAGCPITFPRLTVENCATGGNGPQQK